MQSPYVFSSPILLTPLSTLHSRLSLPQCFR